MVGSDGTMHENLSQLAIERAIRRMSYDYERREEQLKQKYCFMQKRESNLSRYKFSVGNDITVTNAEEGKEDRSLDN